MKPSKPGRRALKWLVFLLLGLFAFYLVAVNLLLGAGLLSPLINRRPEKTFISIGGGWTLLPGRIHVQELLVRGQTQTVQWQLTLGEGSFQVDLPTLIDRRVLISGGSGQDFEFRSRRRLAPGEPQSAEQARYLPEIAGLTNPPDPAPEDVDPPPRGSDRNPWRIEVDEVVLGGKSVLWVGPLQVSGSGGIRGGTVVQPDGVLEVGHGKMDVQLRKAREWYEAQPELEPGKPPPFPLKTSRGSRPAPHSRERATVASALPERPGARWSTSMTCGRQLRIYVFLSSIEGFPSPRRRAFHSLLDYLPAGALCMLSIRHAFTSVSMLTP